jgi:hypothetical protein
MCKFQAVFKKIDLFFNAYLILNGNCEKRQRQRQTTTAKGNGKRQALKGTLSQRTSSQETLSQVQYYG